MLLEINPIPKSMRLFQRPARTVFSVLMYRILSDSVKVLLPI